MFRRSRFRVNFPTSSHTVGLDDVLVELDILCSHRFLIRQCHLDGCIGITHDEFSLRDGRPRRADVMRSGVVWGMSPQSVGGTAKLCVVRLATSSMAVVERRES